MTITATSTPEPRALTGRATAFLGAVIAAAAAAALAALTGFGWDTGSWAAFGLLAGGAAVAQALVVETGNNHGFPVAIGFLVAGALLLPVELVALLGLAQHAPDAVRRAYPWYIQAFNTANYTLNALAAWGAARLVADLDAASDVRWAVAAFLAAVTFVAMNHLLLAVMLRLARGRTFRESGLFGRESLSIDLSLAGLGVALAALSGMNPALVVAVVLPLVLVDRLVRFMAHAQPVPARAPARVR